MSKRSFALSVKTGEYQKNGETKSNYQKVWSMFQRDDWKFSIKIDTLPITKDWEGWLFVNENEKKDQPVKNVSDTSDEMPF